jgi:uncharacterized OsmC-like protein
MNAEQLRAMQGPVKERYRADPAAAQFTMHAEGKLQLDDVACAVTTARGDIEAGLHPGAGGGGRWVCAGDMLLQALVGCAGVTLAAVATALAIPIRGGSIRAEGDLDFRGTLGISKDVNVGFKAIRLIFDLDSDATPEQLDTLIKLSKRYCVVYQTLLRPPPIEASCGGQKN